MAEKRVRVVIDGVEYVSDAAKKAEGGLGGFLGKAKGMLVQLGAVLGAAALGKFFKASVDAANEFESSLRKLDGVARITGTPLSLLNELADTGREKFRLNATTANDLAVEMAKLASKAGDVGKAGPALEAFLNIGAARGLSARDTLTAVQQAILGIDEGTDKLFNANPSVLYEKFADAIGTTAGKLTDQQKAQALLTAALEDGNKVQDAYQQYLRSWAGIQEGVSNGVRQLMVEVGQAITGTEQFGDAGAGLTVMLGNLAQWIEANRGELGKLVDVLVTTGRNLLETVGGAFTTVRPILSATLKVFVALLSESSFAMRAFTIAAQEGIGKVVSFFGSGVSKLANILRRFGIDILGDVGDTMQEWGDRMDAEASARWNGLTSDHSAFWTRMLADTEAGADRVNDATGDMAEGYDASGEAAEDMGGKAKNAGEKADAAFRKAAQEALKFSTALASQVNKGVAQLNKEMGLYVRTQAQVKPAAETIGERAYFNDVNASMASITAHTDKVFKNAVKMGGELPKVSAATEWWAKFQKDVADNLLTAAQGAVNLATSMGGVSRETQTVLSNVLSVAEAFPKMLGGSAAGLLGVVGGVASVLGMMFKSDPARQQLLRENNRRLTELRDEIGNLDLSVSGDDFVAARDTLARIVPQLRGGIGNLPRDLSTFLRELQSSGLSFNDLQEIGKQVGIQLTDSSGKFQMSALSQLLEALNAIEFGQFGQDFAGQLQQTRASVGVLGLDTQGQLNAFGQLFARFSPALAGLDLSDLAGSEAALQGLFRQLQDGTLDAASFGDLTGAQFLDAITTLLDLIRARQDEADDDTGTTEAPPPTDPPSPPPSGAVLDGDGGTITTPTLAATLDDVVATITASTAGATEFHARSLEFAARTADATEATARHTAETAQLVALLARTMDARGASGDTDTQLGAALAVQQRLAGVSSL